MKKIIAYFVDHSFIVNLVAGFAVVVGIFALSGMKRDLHPPFEFQRIVIEARLPGATPAEMERFVTFPIEEAVKSVVGIEKYSSKSESSRTKVKLDFKDDHEDMDRALEMVRTRVNGIRSRLPNTIRSIDIERSQTTDLFLYWIGVENLDDSKEEHRIFLKKFERQANEVDGVVKVNLYTRARGIYINFDPKKLRAYDISVSQAQKVIRESLQFAPIGEMRRLDNRYSIELAKTSKSIDQIANIPVRSNLSGRTIAVSDIAKVEFRVSELTDITRVNGKPGVSVGIRKDLTTDSFELKSAILSLIEKLNKKAPHGVKLVPLVDGPQFVEMQLRVLKKNGLVGLLLVALLLVLFLSWRTAIMTALGLPVAYFGTLIILYSMGINIDLISLVGMILVIGILVDDAIIVSERYVENLEKGLQPREAAIKSVQELMLPVTGTVLTTLVAFSPILLVKSQMSTILAAVPVVVITALSLSFLESFFILPNHLAHAVKRPPVTKSQSLLLKLKRVYKRGLRWSLRYRYLTFAIVLVFSGAAGYLASKKIKQDFQLKIRPERVTVYAFLKESESLEETIKVLKPIEKRLKEIAGDKIENVASFAGWIWMNGHSYQGPRYAQINAYLDRNDEYPEKLKKKIKPLVEEYIKTLPQDKFEKLYVDISRQDSNEDKESMISVRVRGEDDVDYDVIENEIVEASKKVPEIKEMIVDPEKYQMSWEYMPDQEKLALYGLSSFAIGAQVRSAFVPDEIADIRMGGESVSIYTELKKDTKIKYEDLGHLTVQSFRNVNVPLNYLGAWREKKTLRMIRHYNGRRNVLLDFKVNEGEGNEAAARAAMTKALGPVLKKYPSYEIEVKHADENQAKNKAWALKVATVCIIGVMFVMALILGSITQPFIVGLPIPFGIIGIVFALYIHNLPLGLMALIGLVGVVGVSVNASIVMVDKINKLAKERKSPITREILVEGASSRLRAILLTTLTTLAGVFPMAYALGGESGYTQPLAFSLAWGLSFATILTLFLLPALLEIREDFFKSLAWGLTKLQGIGKKEFVPAEEEPRLPENIDFEETYKAPSCPYEGPRV